jgi:L-rhamnose mutarotase
MEKVIFAIKYEVLEEKTSKFLDVVRELKNIVKAEGLESYSVYAAKGKKNIFEEIYVFESQEAYDNFDDVADERTEILMNKLSDLVKPNSTEYLTLTEI